MSLGVEFVAFRGFTLKVFTPCLGVLHEIWGAWCMISCWIFVMNLHIGDDLLSGFLHDSLP
jgi:hypothetical protein